MCADRPRRVAVTGASGFVGSKAVEHLRALGYEVVGFGRRDVARVPAAAQEGYRQWDIESGPLADPPEVDAVVHSAGCIDDWGRYPRFYRGNVVGTENVLATFPNARFVFVSSASV